MTINGRLLLLAVATGLFVRLWAANDRPRVRSQPPLRCQVTYRMPPPDPVPSAPVSKPVSADFVVLPAAATVTRNPRFSTEEFWTPANCPIALPAGIGSGVYRVVDETGRVARLEIAPTGVCAIDAPAPIAAADFLMTMNGSSRWYFIRLQTAAVPPLVVVLPEPAACDLPPVSPDSSATGDERPLCMNRKFDFTGYVPQNWNAAPDPEEIARPEPPELPVSR